MKSFLGVGRRFDRMVAILALAMTGLAGLPGALAQTPAATVSTTGQSAACGIPIFLAPASAAPVLALVDGKEAAVVPAGLSGDARTQALSKICEDLSLRRRMQTGITAPKPLPEFAASNPPPAPSPANPSPAKPDKKEESSGTRGVNTRGSNRGMALPGDYQIVSNVLGRTGSYLPKGQSGMPTGVVLLDSRESARNRALCKGLMGSGTAKVLSEAEARRRDPNGDLVVTHWLVRDSVNDIGDCSELLAKYYFDRSKSIKTTYGLQSLRGPVLMAFDPTGEMMFLDLGGATAEEVTDAADKWMKLALTAPQSGPNAGKPPRPLGLTAGAKQVFADIAGGMGALAKRGREESALTFNDPKTGAPRDFRVFRSGALLIGATFGF